MANKVTQTAGLTFNVNTVKHKLVDFYEAQGISKPMFGGGQTAMTAVLQKVFELMLKESVKRLPGDGKDKSGVKLINSQTLQYGVLLHAGFEQYFLVHLKQYDSRQLYKDQVPISKREMDEFITHIDKDIGLSNEARNFACFLLMKVFLDLAHTCSQLLEFSGKKSLNAKCVMFSVSTKFHDSVACVLKAEIVRVAKATGIDLEDNAGTDDALEDVTKPVDIVTANTDETDELVENTKTSSKKKTTKATETKATTSTGKGTTRTATKTVKQIEVEEAEEEEEEEEEEDEVEIESTEEVEETVNVAPKTSTKNTTKTVAKPTTKTATKTATKTVTKPKSK